MFQERIWHWLTRHPDLSVGNDRKGNALSLADLEARLPAQSSAATPGLHYGKNVSSMDCRVFTVTAAESSAPIPAPQPAGSLNPAESPRIFVTQERMWLTICGHPKDLAKIFETEFALLAIIASYRSAGILQSDLIRESGQDKRSVPQRTDALQKKGYIEKRAVHAKGSRTSRLFLRRFVASTVPDMISRKAANEDNGSDDKPDTDESIDLKVLIRQLFEVLRGRGIVTGMDLRAQLKMTGRWRRRILNRLVRQFEVWGCIKRVKAASEYSARLGWHYQCIKFIREPSEKDLQTYFDTSSNLLDATEGPDSDDGKQENAQRTTRASSAALDEGSLEEVHTVVPQWNPDRLIPNSLRDVVHRAGARGASNLVSFFN